MIEYTNVTYFFIHSKTLSMKETVSNLMLNIESESFQDTVTVALKIWFHNKYLENSRHNYLR